MSCKRKINFYSFHKGIASYRFDHNNSIALERELGNLYDVQRFEYRGSGEYVFQGIAIIHGSILIFDSITVKPFRL